VRRARAALFVLFVACAPPEPPSAPTTIVEAERARSGSAHGARSDEGPDSDDVDSPIVVGSDDRRIEIALDGIAIVPARARVSSFASGADGIVDVDFHLGGGIRIVPLQVGTATVRFRDGDRVRAIEVEVTSRATRCRRTTQIAPGVTRAEHVGDLAAGVSRGSIVDESTAAIVGLLPEGSGMIQITGLRPGHATYWMFPRDGAPASCLRIDVS
jgi:hypothetical protein